MECPHGKSATGAFYNEDYVRHFKELSHRLIGELDKMEEVASIEMYNDIGELRELTR